jgi:hypothetical protein
LILKADKTCISALWASAGVTAPSCGGRSAGGGDPLKIGGKSGFGRRRARPGAGLGAAAARRSRPESWVYPESVGLLYRYRRRGAAGAAGILGFQRFGAILAQWLKVILVSLRDTRGRPSWPQWGKEK